jgi:exosortase B
MLAPSNSSRNWNDAVTESHRGGVHWLLPVAVTAVGFALLYIPAFYTLFAHARDLDRLAHIPVILAISAWLLWRKSREIVFVEQSSLWAWPLLAFAMSLYVFGDTQEVAFLEIGSMIPALMAAILLHAGTSYLRQVWFPIFFMIFMIPWPDAVVDAVTMPVKLAVSHVTEFILGNAGYPIAVSGVVITIAQYQLLVADACSGLQTLFSLEALGILYLSLVRSTSVIRNVSLAILIVPISFFANVMRVIILTLVTYHFGDAAGQGFLHNFSGMAMFFCALLLIIGADWLLEKRSRSFWVPREQRS